MLVHLAFVSDPRGIKPSFVRVKGSALLALLTRSKNLTFRQSSGVMATRDIHMMLLVVVCVVVNRVDIVVNNISIRSRRPSPGNVGRTDLVFWRRAQLRHGMQPSRASDATLSRTLKATSSEVPWRTSGRLTQAATSYQAPRRP